MIRKFAALVGAALLSVGPIRVDMAEAQQAAVQPSPFPSPHGRHRLGYGRLFTNDVIGDGEDRWRTGSITTSRAYGFGWEGQAPDRPFELLELRIQGQIIAPGNLTQASPGDRPYAGALSVGLHSHSRFAGLDMALGTDLVAIGPATQLDTLHKGIHDLLGKPKPSDSVLAGQIGNKIRPTAVVELARAYSLGNGSEMRPFAEARAGDETLVRFGADVTLGRIGQGELLARESVTGQRYRVIYGSGPGISFTLGGDIAYVADSVYLPEERGLSPRRQRERLRAGFHWQGRNASAFYGLTYLGREFDGQSEGQVAGSLRLKLRF